MYLTPLCGYELLPTKGNILNVSSWNFQSDESMSRISLSKLSRLVPTWERHGVCSLCVSVCIYTMLGNDLHAKMDPT